MEHNTSIKIFFHFWPDLNLRTYRSSWLIFILRDLYRPSMGIFTLSSIAEVAHENQNKRWAQKKIYFVIKYDFCVGAWNINSYTRIIKNPVVTRMGLDKVNWQPETWNLNKLRMIKTFSLNIIIFIFSIALHFYLLNFKVPRSVKNVHQESYFKIT